MNSLASLERFTRRCIIYLAIFSFVAVVSPQVALAREVVMSNLRLACVATAMWASSTYAQPLNVQENTSEYGKAAQTFQCKPVEQGQNRIVAADLPHTLIVSLRLKDKKAAEFKVVRVEDNGEKYTQTDQTKSLNLVTIPGRRDYSWYGMAKDHPNLLMHGRLFEQYSAHDGKNRWFYNEEEFEHGLKTVNYRTICGAAG
jgi:hypothetical protein